MEIIESINNVESSKKNALKKISAKYLGHVSSTDEDKVSEGGYWFLYFAFDRDFHSHYLYDNGGEEINGEEKAQNMGLDIDIDDDCFTIAYTDKNKDAIATFIESIGGKVIKYNVAFDRNKAFISKMYLRLNLQEQ